MDFQISALPVELLAPALREARLLRGARRPRVM
jgi:hypothetical protein